MSEPKYQVPTDEHPPYRLHTPEQRREYMIERRRAHRARKGIPVRKPRTVSQIIILERENASGSTVYGAMVREVNKKRTYLSTWTSREEATEACRRYIDTGEKPARAKRGMKLGQKKRPGTPVLLQNPQARPLPTAERLARIGAKCPARSDQRRHGKEQRLATATARTASGAGVDTPKGDGGAPAGSEMTAAQRAARLEQLKAAYRRTA